MPYSIAQYIGDGSNRMFAVPFPFISRDHVSVTVGGTATPVTFQWLTDGLVVTDNPPPNGVVVSVVRNSSRGTLLVDFQDGQSLKEADLDLANKQALYVAQEAFDASDLSTVTTQVSIDATSAATNASAAATSAAAAQSALGAGQAYASQAAASAVSAGTSATNAANSAASAAASAASIVPANYLLKANNLSDVPSAATARTNLGAAAASSSLQADGSVTASTATLLSVAGNLAYDSNKFAFWRNASANTNGKQWAWLPGVSGANDYVAFHPVNDAGVSGSYYMRMWRTANVPTFIEFPNARVSCGGVGDDGVTSLQTFDLSVTGGARLSGGLGIGSGTTINYAGYTTALTLQGATNVGLELVSTRADATSVTIGAIEGRYNTNSAGHERIATVSFQTEGTTANQRGGAVVFATKANASTALTERMRVTQDGNVLVGTAALATTATNGFLYIPQCAGAPTGVPTSFAGRSPMVFDTTNNKLWVHNGTAWKGVALA